MATSRLPCCPLILLGTTGGFICHSCVTLGVILISNPMVLWTECLCSPEIHMLKALTANVTVSEGETLGGN